MKNSSVKNSPVKNNPIRKSPIKNRWNMLYFLLAGLIAFALFGVPRIAQRALDNTKGEIVFVEAMAE